MAIVVTTTQKRTGVKYTRTAATRNTISDNIIGTATLPYMRSVTTVVEGFKLRPNVNFRPFFDGIDVSNYCTPDAGFSVGGGIFKTDQSGYCKGSFTIPSNDTLKFTTGKKKFLLIEDTPSVPVDLRSQGSGEFESNGGEVTRRKTYTTIRFVRVTAEGLSQSKTTVGYEDPIAQSFVVTHNPGIFCSSIGIWFANKDAHLPVSCEIVKVQSGFPQTEHLPFAKVAITPSQVNTSPDATAETIFTFPEPIFMVTGEYALVVKTNSNPSNKATYEMFYAKLGEPEILAGGSVTNRLGAGIRKQPYAGVMFKSQNASTWTEDQMSDVKFRIYRHKFSTAPSNLNLILKNLPNIPTLPAAAGPDITDFSLRVGLITIENTNTSLQANINSTIFETTIDFPYQINSRITLTNTSSFMASIGLTSSDDYISPVVDLEKSVAILSANRVNDDGDPDGTGYQYRMGTYISKPTRLDHESNDLKVIVDVEQKLGTETFLFYKTIAQTPHYINVDTVSGQTIENNVYQSDFIGKALYVYYFDSVSGTISKPVSTTVMTEYQNGTGVGLDQNRIYVKDISAINSFDWFSSGVQFVDTIAGTAAPWDNLLISDDGAMIEGVIAVWDIAKVGGYQLGELVLSNGNIFEWFGVAGGNSAAAPTSNGTEWKIIKILYSSLPTQATDPNQNLMIEDTEVIWQPLQLDPSISLDSFQRSQIGDLAELTYVPKRAISEPFTTFQVKLIFRSTDGALTPDIQNLRVIAAR